MKNRDFSTYKYVMLGILFIVTGVITFISMNYESESPATTTMTEATLPVVMMQTDTGMLFNEQHGYTCDIDESLINDSITPLPTDKKLQIVIDTYGQNVTSISYKVRELSDMSLIENTVISDYETTDDTINATLNIKNLIEDDTEYLLDIVISTDDQQEINYYTKIISGTDYEIQDQLDFVLDFNAKTFDSSQLSDLSQYLETTSSGTTSNLGKVTINSSLSQIGWGDLNPFIESSVIPTIKEIDGDVAIITLDYTMGAENDYDAYDTYTVNEYYRVRQSGSTMYLLNYEREANQIFDSRNDLTDSTSINLGILSDTDVTTSQNEEGTITYFINQGTLWCYDEDSNLFTKVFTFDEDDSDHVRERYDQYDIKIIDVKDDGDCDFLIIGYMNRGEHEGEVGISLFTYQYDENVVNEQLFIPISIPYDILSENAGEVAYISDSNAFYILIDQNLYAIDLTSKEVMTEVSGLTDDTFAVSADGKSIAYSTNGELYNTDTIKILNMENETGYAITADEGDKLKVVGYINQDFIYGVAHQSDIVYDQNGTVTFPMYELNIVNEQFEQIKNYQEDGIYISDASVEGLRINLSRVVRQDDGTYQSTTVDQLINKDEEDDTTTVSVGTISTTDKLQEVVLTLKGASADTTQTAMRSSKEVLFNQGEEVSVVTDFTGSDKYYVYGYGTFQGSYSKISEAIAQAYDTYGSVLDYNNEYIWRRYKDTSASITGLGTIQTSQQPLVAAVSALTLYIGSDLNVATLMNGGASAIDVLNQCTDNQALSLDGVAVDKVLYFISAGYPVIGRIGESSYAIITAYDSTNVVYTDCSTGVSTTKTITDASKIFSQWGNMFITYYK